MGVRRAYWLVVLALMITGWMIVPVECSAEVRCPWLNAATASGVLGGDVQMTVTAPVDPGAGKGVGTAMYPDQVRMDRFDVSCDFSRKVDSGVSSLRIVVKTMSDPTKDFGMFLALCGGTKVALKAIGNEAVQCVMKSNSGLAPEQVIARVRDRAFVLTISREAVNAVVAQGDELSDDARNVAEQVAGSLF